MRSASLVDNLYLLSTSYCSNLRCAWRSKTDDVHVQSDTSTINGNNVNKNIDRNNLSNIDETVSRPDVNTTKSFHNKMSTYENEKWYWDEFVERHLHPPVRFRPISETNKYINLTNKYSLPENEEELHEYYEEEYEDLERSTLLENTENIKEDHALKTPNVIVNDNTSNAAMSSRNKIDFVDNINTGNNYKDYTESKNNFIDTHSVNDFDNNTKRAKSERAKRSSVISTGKVITNDIMMTATTINDDDNGISSSSNNKNVESNAIARNQESNSSELSFFPECTQESLATMTQTETLFESIHAQTEQSRYESNQLIPFPPSPEAMVPEFRRIKKHARLKILTPDEENYPTFTRRDVSVALPPAPKHPWLPYCPTGPHIVHGDGAINMTGGTGEVGFEDHDRLKLTTSEKKEQEQEQEQEQGKEVKAAAASPNIENQPNVIPSILSSSVFTHAQTTLALNHQQQQQQEKREHKDVSNFHDNSKNNNTVEDANNEPLRCYPKSFRGLQHHSILNHHLPEKNGKVLHDMVIRYSFGSTGRGIFATRDIKKGEVLMIVQSTAQSLGVKGEIHRLEEMCVDILLTAYEQSCSPDNVDTNDECSSNRCNDTKQFLHSWIFNGQPSSLLENWPAASTTRVIYAIGGYHVLHALELHPVHIARLAAIIDMNSFLVESYYAHRKGMAYFPEAGYLNHSCTPNASYEIMPEHVFGESKYNNIDNHNDNDVEVYNNEGKQHEQPTESEEWEEEEEFELLLETNKLESANSLQNEQNQIQKEQKEQIQFYNFPSSSYSCSNIEASTATSKSTRIYELSIKDELPDCNASENEKSKNTLMPLRQRPESHNHHNSLLRVNAARNATYLKELAEGKVNLTSSGAPTYLFCCRAERDIAANEEVFISYVPTSWTFNARQQVLHDRYKFWCKCEKCSPYVDERTMHIARWTVWVLIFFMFLQVVVSSARKMRELENEDIQNALMHNANYEARQRELEKRGIRINYFQFINNKTTSSPNAEVQPYVLNEEQAVNDDILASLHKGSSSSSNNKNDDNKKHKSIHLSDRIRKKKLDSLFERENVRGSYQSRAGDNFLFETPRKMY